MRALDAKTGTHVWDFELPSPSWAGVMATAGGLVFSGSNEGNFFALDAKTGKPLWQFQEVAADFGQQDLADARAVGGEDVDAVVAVADPAHGGPDVAVDVAADAVGKAGHFLPLSCIVIEANSRPLASRRPSMMSYTLMFFGASG